MLRLLIDENFDQRILRGLRLRLPQLDYIIAQRAGMSGLSDSALLDWAASHGRIIVTHDESENLCVFSALSASPR